MNLALDSFLLILRIFGCMVLRIQPLLERVYGACANLKQLWSFIKCYITVKDLLKPGSLIEAEV